MRIDQQPNSPRASAPETCADAIQAIAETLAETLSLTALIGPDDIDDVLAQQRLEAGL